jgi:hypothetical protein
MAEINNVSKISLAVITLISAFLFLLLAFLVYILLGNALYALSTSASVALVVATATLAYFTRSYSIAADNLVAATQEQASATKEQVAATQEQASATKEQVAATQEQASATKEQVAALTKPILYVDMSIIERPIQNLEGVPIPQALELFVKNVGSGDASNIILDMQDDYRFFIGNSFVSLKKEIAKSNITRLAPGQKRTLAVIVLGENRSHGKFLDDLTVQREIRISYKNSFTTDECSESSVLDFAHYLELADRLSAIPYTTQIN